MVDCINYSLVKDAAVLTTGQLDLNIISKILKYYTRFSLILLTMHLRETVVIEHVNYEINHMY